MVCGWARGFWLCGGRGKREGGREQGRWKKEEEEVEDEEELGGGWMGDRDVIMSHGTNQERE